MEISDSQVSIKAERSGREFFLICDKESTLGELFDVICIYKNHVLESMKKADENCKSNIENESFCEEK